MLEKKDGGILFKCKKLQKVNKKIELQILYYDAKNQKKFLKGFINGKQQTMVATNMFGMGIDVVDIRVIVHVNEPKIMLDYIQENK